MCDCMIIMRQICRLCHCSSLEFCDVTPALVLAVYNCLDACSYTICGSSQCTAAQTSAATPAVNLHRCTAVQMSAATSAVAPHSVQLFRRLQPLQKWLLTVFSCLDVCSHASCGCSQYTAVQTYFPHQLWLLTVYSCFDVCSYVTFITAAHALLQRHVVYSWLCVCCKQLYAVYCCSCVFCNMTLFTGVNRKPIQHTRHQQINIACKHYEGEL